MPALAINRLDQIAETVRAEHVQLETAMRESLARAVKIGALLTEAKQLVRHGEWGKWITDNCQFSERTAQNYMRISARFPELGKSATVADLTYREAIALLAEPKQENPADPRPEDRQAFIQTLEALREIRDNRLYKKNYPTFADYCRERWGFDDSLIGLIGELLE